MRDWQPMATAPRDGTAVLLALSERHYPRVLEGVWRGDVAYPWWDTRPRFFAWDEPIAWMPMPEPPALSEEPSDGR